MFVVGKGSHLKVSHMHKFECLEKFASMIYQIIAPYCLISSFFSSQVTDAIIKGISGSNYIFGGDLLAVVRLLEPILRKYNRDNEEVYGLTENMFNISNALLASCTAWTELADFHQRYLLSTKILSNIDNTGFLFLSVNLLNFIPTNFTTRFTFQHLDVILDTIDPERVFPHCYDFEEVTISNHKFVHTSSPRALFAFPSKL